MSKLYKSKAYDYVVELVQVVEIDGFEDRFATREMEIENGIATPLYKGDQGLSFHKRSVFERDFAPYKVQAEHGLYVAKDQHGLATYFLVNDQWEDGSTLVWRLSDDGDPTYRTSLEAWQELNSYKGFRKAATHGGMTLKFG